MPPTIKVSITRECNDNYCCHIIRYYSDEKNNPVKEESNVSHLSQGERDELEKCFFPAGHPDISQEVLLENPANFVVSESFKKLSDLRGKLIG